MASVAASNEQEAACGHASSRSRSDGQSVVGECGSELGGHRAGQFSISSSTGGLFCMHNAGCTKVRANIQLCGRACDEVAVASRNKILVRFW